MPSPTELVTADSELTRWIERLEVERQAYELPVDLRNCVEAFVRRVLALLFPHFAGWAPAPGRSVEEDIERVRADLLNGLRPLAPDRAATIADEVIAELPHIHEMLLDDAGAIFNGDPAAESEDEVILAYPGFLAVAIYRIAHVLYRAEVPILPRLLTEFAHRETGIDIHPGAQIGRAFAIDHGTGVVIGETTVIGERVRVFQGVTLGALSVVKEMARTKRHPTIEDDVVIYANATILGGRTVIGARTLIGGNVWLTQSVPPDCIVTHRSDIRLQSEAEDLIEYHI